jgi:hypothetical protein
LLFEFRMCRELEEGHVSLTAETGGSSSHPSVGQARPNTGGTDARWIALFVFLFVVVAGGSYLLVRGRLGGPAQVAPVATAAVAVQPTIVSAAATAAPQTTPPASSTPGSQATTTADQAASWYLYQQSHEQDYCSCNTANPPSSP